MNVITLFKAKVVDPCMMEGEACAIRSRKLGVIALSIIASNAFFAGIPVTVIAILNYPGVWGVYVFGAAVFQLLLTCSIFPYQYVRITKRLPDWIVDFQMWSTAPIILCFSLFAHQSSVLVACSACIYLGIVLRMRGWKLFVLYGLCVSVLHALINDYGEELPALRKTFYSTQLFSIRLFNLFGSSMATIVLFSTGLHYIIKESTSRADQADAAIAMNLAVAEKLRRYDTDGVAVILAANKGKVDEKLLEAFAAIQRNLEEYRPHIPDYVIAASVSECSPSTDDEDEGELRVSQQSRLLARTSTCSIESGKSKVIELSDEGEKSSTHTSMSGGRTPLRQKSSIPSEVASSRHQHFYGRATTIFIRFTSPVFGTEHGSSSQALKMNAAVTAATLTNCVDAASKHAKVHGGAMQYMQGCGMMVSFNAASRVATHEANACAFALALKTSVEELPHPDLVMHATIVTTNVLSFFAGNSSQLMLTILGGFMPVHTAMHHYLSQTVGKAASCVLLSDSVVPTIEMMYDHRLLGMTMYADDRVHERSNVNVAASLARPSSSTITELLTLKTNSDEEWLYHAAERTQNDPITLSNNVVRAALEGGSIPVEFSTQCDTSDVVLMKCVKERLEVCDRDKTRFEVQTAPIVMW